MKNHLFKIAAMAGVAAGSLAMPSVAQAAHTITQCSPAQLANVVPSATKCYYVQPGSTANGGGPSKQAVQQEVINDYLQPSGYTYDGTSFAASVELSPLNGSNVDFGQQLFGETIVSFHFGGGANSPFGQQETTAFYLFDLAVPVNSLTLVNSNSISNARLFTTQTPGVPEPGTWLMLLLGFFGMGGVLRYQKRSRAKVTLSYS